MANIAVGSVVQLKSGGPYMKVQKIEDGQSYGLKGSQVLCAWFDDKGSVQSHVFGLDMLEPRQE